MRPGELHRLLVRIHLVADEPLRPGENVEPIPTNETGPVESKSGLDPRPLAVEPESIARVARSDTGQAMVAGTSMAGVLRSVVSTRLGRVPNELFGYVARDEQATSALVVKDTSIPIEDSETEVVCRTRSPMDRSTGATSHGLLHTGEQLEHRPALTIEAELRSRSAESESPLAELLDEILAVGLRVGKGTRKGFGHLECVRLELIEVDLDQPAAFEDWLVNRHRSDAPRPWERAIQDPHAWITERLGQTKLGDGNGLRPWGGVQFTLHLRPIDPLAAATSEGIETGQTEVQVLEATRVLGALRSRAERIVRTMAGENGAVWDPVAYRVDRDAGPPNDELDPATALFGSTSAASFIAVRDAQIRNPTFQRFDGVAIDRYLGGAADKLKFETHAVTNGIIELTLTLQGFHARHLGLLTLVLLETVDGDIAFGRRTQSGFGSVALQRVTAAVRGDTAEVPLPGLAKRTTQWQEVGTATIDPAEEVSRSELLDSLGSDLSDWLRSSIRDLQTEWEMAG